MKLRNSLALGACLTLASLAVSAQTTVDGDLNLPATATSTSAVW